MSEVTLPAELFGSRVKQFQDAWMAAREDKWKGADAISIFSGKASDDETITKTKALQRYLIGYEFTDTILLFTKAGLHVVAGAKKIEMLKPCAAAAKAAGTKVTLLARSKADGNKANFEQLLAAAKASFGGTKVAGLPKEATEGAFAEGWRTALAEADGVEAVDGGLGMAVFLSVKPADCLEHVKKAALLTSKILKHCFVREMEEVIDKEGKVSHAKLAEGVSAKVEDEKELKKLGIKLRADVIEVALDPIVQSGGSYDLSIAAQSDDRVLTYDVITCSLGTRYRNFCSLVSRTYFIDPPKTLEKAYMLLLEVQKACYAALQPGKTLGSVYDAALALVKRKAPELVDHFSKTVGFGVGIEVREGSFVLKPTNAKVLKKGMVFNVSVAFGDLKLTDEEEAKRSQRNAKLPRGAAYACQLADTVVVGGGDSDAALEVTRSTKKWSDVAYFLDGSDSDDDDSDDDEDEEEEEEEEEESKAAGGDGSKKKKKAGGGSRGDVDMNSGGIGDRAKARRAHLQVEQAQAVEAEEKRQKNQAKLKEEKRLAALKRMRAAQAGAAAAERDKASAADGEKAIAAYDRPTQYPREAIATATHVDMDREVVFLPINGRPVPFHISTIKNVSKQDEEEATYLRINFYTPGQALGKDAPAAMVAAVARWPLKIYIKEMTIRAVKGRNISQQFRLIKELQKRARASQREELERADLVEQADLHVDRTKRYPRLTDIDMRPRIKGKKGHGTLELHSNGLRFRSVKGDQCDVLFTNMKHVLYQPCIKEHIVLIHFHLRHPIMIGKKKHKDLTFFTEVVEASQALDQRRRSMYDPDELAEEQRERDMRNKLNATFQEFTRKIEKVADKHGTSLKFDVPYRELQFQGTPFREMVNLQPSVDCLVNLTEVPAYVVSLSDIEHVHFERVTFQSKNFDMVIIFKDFSKEVSRVSAVPMENIDMIKEWLDDIHITFTAGQATLKWPAIMTAIRDQGEYFWMDEDEEGEKKPVGFDILSGDADEEEEVREWVGGWVGEGVDGCLGGWDDEDDESEFSEGDEESDSDDDDDDSLVDEDELEDSDDEDEDEDDEDAADWSDMEEEARESDKRANKRMRESEQEEAAAKRKKKGGRR
eukprot:g2039.t1